MLDLEKVREVLKRHLEKDRALVSVTVKSWSLDDALLSAAVQLNLPLKSVGYEVITKGSPGFLGFSKKEWEIKAYELIHKKKSDNEHDDTSASAFMDSEASVVEDKNGEAIVHLSADGVYFKVVPAAGSGIPATMKDAVRALKERSITQYDKDLVQNMLDNPDNTYRYVGMYAYNPANDAVVSVDISEDEMKAFLYVIPPGAGGADVSSDVIMTFLRNNRVVVGIDETAVQAFHDKPVYKQNYLIAEGIAAYDGKDAHMVYNFETEQNKIRLKEDSSGKIDFRELNLIQNVVEGQPLARKVPAERGRAGKTVTGKYLEAKNGKDIPLPIGKNVHVAEDNLTLIAEKNGQVILNNNKINVEPILEVPGDVSIKTTGNIMFLGTVIINGNVEDGLSVKASGNIEVRGTVGKCEIDAEGDVVVGQGITGRNEGLVRAGKTIWARFVENATVSAGELVIVSDGIINSQVTAKRKILCQGKRASIVGGHLRAAEEIHAKSLGSAGGGSETILEVGFDPEEKEKLDLLVARQGETQLQLDDVELNLSTLQNQKKLRKALSEEKEESLQSLMKQKQLLKDRIEELTTSAHEIQTYLNSLKTRGHVSASVKVFAGVVIIIREVKELVRSDCKATTFCLESGLIRYGKYEGPDEDMKKVPDGYASN